MSELSSFEWDEVLDNTLQLHWRAVLTILDNEPISFFHISSEHNLADIVSKHHNIKFSNVDASSSWQSGLPRMSDPFEGFSITQTPYNKLNVSLIYWIASLDLRCRPGITHNTTTSGEIEEDLVHLSCVK